MRGALRAIVLLGCIIASGAACHQLQAASSTQVVPPASGTTHSPASPVRTVLDRYCVTCHNQRLRTAGLALDEAALDDVAGEAELWEKVVHKLRTGTMPPGDRPRPGLDTYDTVARWLEDELDRAAATRPNPGRRNAVHRLNRTEYRNAIRDLLALDIDVTSLVPGENTADGGFDNNADVLSITTAQLERYLSAARKISRLATGLSPTAPVIESFRVPLQLIQDDRQSEDLPLGSRGGTAIQHYFPVDGDYVIKVRLRRTYNDYVMGMGTPHQLDIRIDGALVRRFSVGGEAEGTPTPDSFAGTILGDPEWEEYVLQADEGLEARVPVRAGPRLVGVSFVRKTWAREGILQPRDGGSVLSNSEVYAEPAAVDTVEIGGPYAMAGPGDTPSRRKIFVCRPERGADETPCAAAILTRLARLAYRRPVTDRDVQPLMRFFGTGRAEGGSFDAGMQLALERLLVDPDFLLRVERPSGGVPGEAHRLTDLEIASRLSFFLWSSLPDDALLTAAERATLSDPQVLERHVRRMLADPRADTLVEDFAAQWLHLRKLDTWAANTRIYPYFDDNLVDAFRQETQLFLTSMLREDRSVLDLLRADYTFVNERLARHYGIPGVYGNRFRRVTLPDLERRGGVLAHGGLLALSSYPNRTSPVLRGKWLLDTIFGAPPPAPPPNVPALPERGEGGVPASVRERLQQHRNSPACASCHATIDPLGFALENYDAIGAWRTTGEGGRPIDSTGTMPSGVQVDGLPGLRNLLLSQPDRFVHTVTEKLLAYALGRRIEYYDQPTVRAIVRDIASRDYRWSSLVLGIVESPALQMRVSGAAN